MLMISGNIAKKGPRNRNPIKLFIKKININRFFRFSTNFYIITLTFISLLIPSHSNSIFSGIPLNTKIEFFVLLFLISYAFGLVLIKKLNFSFNKNILLFSLSIVLFISLKTILLVTATDHPRGFKACYRSLIYELPEEQCEFSFDYYLKSNKQFTRYDETIDFDSDWIKAGLYDPLKSSNIVYRSWKLGFWDELRFIKEHQWIKGNQLRERNPFEVIWRGNALIPSNSKVKLSIEYTGEGKIRLGNNTILLPKNYKSKKTFFIDLNEILTQDITKQNNELSFPIRIYYKFQDFSKVGMNESKLGPNSNISVKFLTKEGTTHLRSYYVKDITSIILSRLLDSISALLLLMMIISHIIFLYIESKFLFVVYFLGGIILIFNLQSKPLKNFIDSPLNTSVFLLLVFAIDYLTRRKKGIAYFFISFFFLTQLFFHVNTDLKKVFYRYPGSDHMTYESHARSIGKAENISTFLRGEENIFYYQPFFRYYLAFNHILLGDGNNSVSIFYKFLFLFSIPFIFLFFSQRLKFIPALFFSLAFMNVIYKFVFFQMYEGLSEYSAYLFLIMAVYLLFFNRYYLGYFLGFALIGFATITRFNFLPGCCYLILVFYIYYLFNGYGHKIRQKKFRFVLISILILLVIYSLVPLHNFYFGHELVLTTNSVHLNPHSSLSILVHSLSDEKAMQNVMNRLKLMFYLDWNNSFDKNIYSFKNHRLLNLFLFLLAISFFYNLARLGKIIRAKKYRNRPIKEIILNLLFIMSPLPFLSIYLYFDLESYYPRFIVMGHIMICLFSVYSSSSLINWGCEKAEKLFSLIKINSL